MKAAPNFENNQQSTISINPLLEVMLNILFNKIFHTDSTDFKFELGHLSAMLENLVSSEKDTDFLINTIHFVELIIYAKLNPKEFITARFNDNSTLSLLVKATKEDKIPVSLLQSMCWYLANDNDLKLLIQNKSQQELEQYFGQKLKFDLVTKKFLTWNDKIIKCLTDELALQNLPLTSNNFGNTEMDHKKFKAIKQQLEYNQSNKYFIYETTHDSSEIPHFHILANALKQQKVITHVKATLYENNLKELLEAIHEGGTITHLILKIISPSFFDTEYFLEFDLNKMLKEFFNKNKTLLSLSIESDYKKLIETNFEWLRNNTSLQELKLITGEYEIESDENEFAFANLFNIFQSNHSTISTLKIVGYISEQAKNNLVKSLPLTKIKSFSFVGEDDPNMEWSEVEIKNYLEPIILASYNLTSLDLSHLPLENKHILALIQLLEGENQLRYLNISDVLDISRPKPKKEFTSLEKLIEVSTHLTSLQTHGNELSKKIVQKVLSSKQLKSLSIDLSLDVDELYTLLNENQNLNELTIYCSPYQLNKFFIKSYALQKNPYLYSLKIKLNSGYRDHEFVETMVDYGCVLNFINNVSNTSIFQLNIMNIISKGYKLNYHKLPSLTNIVNSNRDTFNSDLIKAYCLAYFNLACFYGKYEAIRYKPIEPESKKQKTDNELVKIISIFPPEIGQKLVSYLPLSKGKIGKKHANEIYIEMTNKVKKLK